MNRYQQRKARRIAAVLMMAAVATDTCYFEAGMLAARMSQDQWRTVAFTAGCSVADTPVQKLAVAYLLSVG